MTEPVLAAGVILFRENPQREFLLMRHATRWDLPKGHLDPGETLIDCALREMTEETGIRAEHVRLDPDFRFEIHYPVTYPDKENTVFQKTLTIFLAWLMVSAEIVVTEHEGYAWFAWSPSHHFGNPTLDPLLADVAAFWSAR